VHIDLGKIKITKSAWPCFYLKYSKKKTCILQSKNVILTCAPLCGTIKSEHDMLDVSHLLLSAASFDIARSQNKVSFIYMERLVGWMGDRTALFVCLCKLLPVRGNIKKEQNTHPSLFKSKINHQKNGAAYSHKKNNGPCLTGTWS